MTVVYVIVLLMLTAVEKSFQLNSAKFFNNLQTAGNLIVRT